ncbi:phosphatidylinositol 4-kinase A [Nematocida major]|uniref:phosphatidylinositol 4-kinase A n=1 Tax=Nematocida major TaxID=1912982 RepID=UPI002007BE69|nr:phosphatidylinositol 4-kinase A [Nematocida major]KAH9386437.1 phosphatidylinositol 4-kinase A [Nematocida major]
MEEKCLPEQITCEEYIRMGEKIETPISLDKAKEMFLRLSLVEGYEEESVHAQLLSYVQAIEQQAGLNECFEMIEGALHRRPKRETDIAQINAVLEVTVAKIKKYEGKWLDRFSEPEIKPKAEAPLAQEKSSTDILEIPKHPLPSIIRSGLFTIKKLARLRHELRLRKERAEKAVEEEEAKEEEEEKTLLAFLESLPERVVEGLSGMLQEVDSTKLFMGDWEGTMCPNMQLDFIELSLSFLEMHIRMSVKAGRALGSRSLLESLTCFLYKQYIGHLGEQFIEELEVELVGCFSLAMQMSILLKGPAFTDCFSLFSEEGKTILQDAYIFYVQNSALNALGLLYHREKNQALVDIVYSFYTTGCLDVFMPQQKKQIISSSVDILTKYLDQESIMVLIRKIIYLYDSAAQRSEGMSLLVSIFLSKIRSRSKSSTKEINEFFIKIISRSQNKIEHIDSYCTFLSMHDIGIPLHHLIRRYDPQFISTFYSTYFRHPFTQEKGTQAVGDFINFVCMSADLTYIYIMNMVPFIPTSPFIVHKLFLIYKRIYANASIFTRGIETELLLLRMKTPALVGIAGFIFSDPTPLIKKKDLKKMAAVIGISPNLNEDYIVFLSLVYTVEAAKLENYNYKGIISYLKDEVTLKYMGKHLPCIITRLHREASVESLDFYKTYACDLLKVASVPTAYPLSLKIIVEILTIIVQKEPSVVLSEEFHQRFKECFDTFRGNELSMFNLKETFLSYMALYKSILSQIKEEVIEVYNYIVLNIVDLGLFNALPVMRDERGIKELLNRSNLIMEIIRTFPTTPMPGTEIWEWMYSVCTKKPARPALAQICSSGNGAPSSSACAGHSGGSAVDLLVGKAPLTEEEYSHLLYAINTEWINDLIIMRSGTPGIIENTRNYLRWMLVEEYSLESLLILLKVSNREEKRELLKKAVLTGYCVKDEPAVYYSLYTLAKGTFYEYPLAQTYNFLCALDKTRKSLKVRKLKEQELYDLGVDELIFLSTEYGIKKVDEVLLKKHICRCSGFFVDMSRLTSIEALSVVGTSEDEQEIEKALNFLEAEESRGNTLLFFTPQIVQLLRKNYARNGPAIKEALTRIVRNKTAHALIWEIKAHGDSLLQSYEEGILNEMTHEEREQYNKQSEFLKSFTHISEKLQKYVSMDRDAKKRLINQAISEVSFPEGCYLPTTGETVIKLVEGSGRALQSAEKVPYMVTFKVNDEKTNEVVDRQVIFKFGDDCRQDVLALQIIQIFQNIFKGKGLSVYLYPYKVLATGFGSGIIEVIPHSTSRDQIGRERVNNLVDYFSLKYGYREGHKYSQALKNFVESFAGYSLVTYILNIKDRHNGNIMLTDEGHLIHIDFGFMLDISPGSINIESPIKITDEIFSLLGGADGEAFMLYKDLMVKGFYILRKRAKEIVLMIDMGRHSGLSCYTSATMKNLVSRFRLDLEDAEVPAFVYKLITSSTKKLRTWIYDQYQHLTNNIAF